jgi:death on curing protein
VSDEESDDVRNEGSDDEPMFLDVEDILELHAAQLGVFGGGSGVRDRGLLESAVAQPQTSFGGAFTHQGLFEMAAAYLFHLVSNHPFVDGNKRAGLLSAIIFLDLNGISLDRPSDRLYELTMRVAESQLDKAAIATELVRIVKSHALP